MGFGLPGIVIVQQALGVLSAILIVILGLRLFGRNAIRWAVIGGILFAVCPAVLFYETRFLKPSWNILLLLLTLFLCASTNRDRYVVPLAFLTAGLCLFEAYFLMLALVVTLILFRDKKRLGLLYAVVFTSIITPVAVANSVAAKSFIPISSNGGVNFDVGNNAGWVESYNTLPGWEWKYMIRIEDSDSQAYGDRARIRTASFGHDAIKFMANEPLKFVSALAQKFLMAFSVTETYRDIDMSIDGKTPLPNILVNATILILFGLAAPYRRREAVLLVFVVAVLLFVNIVFFPSTRYRIPMLALMCAGIPAIFTRRNDKYMYFRGGAVTALILLGTWMVARNFDRASWHSLRNVQTAEKLVIKGHNDDADRYFQFAISVKPTLYARQRYGEFLLCMRGQPDRAHFYFNSIIKSHPDFPDAYFYLALMFKERKEYSDAYRAYSSYIIRRDNLGYPDDCDIPMLIDALYFCSLYQSMQTGNELRYDPLERLETVLQIATAKERPYNPVILQNVNKMRRVKMRIHTDT